MTPSARTVLTFVSRCLQRHNARRRKKASDTEASLRVSVPSRKLSGGNTRRPSASTSPTAAARDGGAQPRSAGRHSARQIAALLEENAAAVNSGNVLGDSGDGVPSVSVAADGEEWNSGGANGGGGGARAGQRPNLENALSELLSDSQTRHPGAAVSLEAIQVPHTFSPACADKGC